LRFAGTGGLAGMVQLAILALLTRHGWNGLQADAVAFLLAAQVNFLLSVTFTWQERQEPGSLPRRWLLYHGSIGLMAIVNLLTFAVARTVMPTLVASVAGIAAGAVGNYVAGDRLVFRSSRAGGSIVNKRRAVV
jgi:putative flippase GtrA